LIPPDSRVQRFPALPSRLCRASRVQRSGIECSNISNLSLSYLHLILNVNLKPVSGYIHLSPVICPLYSAICPLSSVFCHLSSVFCPLIFSYPHRLVALYPSLYKKRPPFLNCCGVGMSNSKASARRSITLKEKQTYMASSMAWSDRPEERRVSMSSFVTCCGCRVNFCKNPKTLRRPLPIGAVSQLSITAWTSFALKPSTATAVWAPVQNWHWFCLETKAAKSSTSPLLQAVHCRIASCKQSAKYLPNNSRR